MYEKFWALSKEKQLRIINAGMEVFSKNEYKRASTDLIAAKAGISKGLLFYYFHNKKEFYMFLYQYLYEIMKSQVVDQPFLEITDFFELLEAATLRKVEILEQTPYIMDFAMQAFYSEKEDVSDELKNMNVSIEKEIFKQYFSNLDTYKFKDGGENIFHIYKMLLWMADGYMHELRTTGQPYEVKSLKAEFEKWMGMFKKFTYKEEYQDE